MKKHISESKYPIIERKTIHQNPFFSVVHEHIEVKGEREDFYIVHKDHYAVFVVPVHNGKILLISQYRQHSRSTGWEIPAGACEPLEEINKGAHRELVEESGYQARTLKVLGTFFLVPGLSDVKGYAILATDLHKEQKHLDISEDITRQEFFEFAKVKQMIQTGEITDAMTICALHYFFLENT